jgi:hypothetical protein
MRSEDLEGGGTGIPACVGAAQTTDQNNFATRSGWVWSRGAIGVIGG